MPDPTIPDDRPSSRIGIDPQVLRRIVVCLSAMLAVQGLSWAVMGSFEPTGLYDGLLARSQLGVDVLPEDAVAIQRFFLVPFGATDAAYFVLAAGVAWFAFDERWALGVVAGSFAMWWGVDTLGCVALGAWFNIAVVNVPCLLIYGPALLGWAAVLPRRGSGDGPEL